MPEVSVIVCTYNRDQYIRKTLECLRNQTRQPDEFEVLVINNNSTDQTAAVCSAFLEEHNLDHFHYYVEESQGHTFARNRGISEAKGNILAFIDDDAFVYSDYITGIISSFQNYPDAVALGGKIMPIYESGQAPKWMSKFLLPLVAALDMGEQVKPFRKGKFPIGANMAFRKNVFEKYGLFDVRLGRRGFAGLEGGDEKDVFHRLNKDSQIIIYDPNVRVDHIIPEKRVQLSYVKGLALGVGTSEKKRLKNQGNVVLLQKWWEEGVKLAGTMLLFAFYLISLRPTAAVMLLRFRFWVIKGLMT